MHNVSINSWHNSSKIRKDNEDEYVKYISEYATLILIQIDEIIFKSVLNQLLKETYFNQQKYKQSCIHNKMTRVHYFENDSINFFLIIKELKCLKDF